MFVRVHVLACVCVRLYVCVAIQHESDAAGRLRAAKVVVWGTVKGGDVQKINQFLRNLALMFCEEIVHQDILQDT